MNLEEALVQAFQEYNAFGLAAQSSAYHLADREMFGIKELWHNWFVLLSALGCHTEFSACHELRPWSLGSLRKLAS